ncbi:MAG: hypothetical protein AAGK78_01740 [Planctomycetota bacterium]
MREVRGKAWRWIAPAILLVAAAVVGGTSTEDRVQGPIVIACTDSAPKHVAAAFRLAQERAQQSAQQGREVAPKPEPKASAADDSVWPADIALLRELREQLVAAKVNRAADAPFTRRRGRVFVPTEKHRVAALAECDRRLAELGDGAEDGESEKQDDAPPGPPVRPEHWPRLGEDPADFAGFVEGEFDVRHVFPADADAGDPGVAVGFLHVVVSRDASMFEMQVEAVLLVAVAGVDTGGWKVGEKVPLTGLFAADGQHHFTGVDGAVVGVALLRDMTTAGWLELADEAPAEE